MEGVHRKDDHSAHASGQPSSEVTQGVLLPDLWGLPLKLLPNDSLELLRAWYFIGRIPDCTHAVPGAGPG